MPLKIIAKEAQRVIIGTCKLSVDLQKLTPGQVSFSTPP
jgi:hypothetical protein